MVVKEPYDSHGLECKLFEVGEKITCEQNTFASLCSAFFDYCKDLPPHNYVNLCLLFIEKEVIATGKISNELIEIEYSDNSKEVLNVTPIQTRKEAIELCNKFTKEALKKDNAFENLHIFKNNFNRHRNNEIETYLEKITGDLSYRIVEFCPFDSFSWFDA